MSSASAEADILQNRTNVARARSQRLIDSWLPATTNIAANGAQQQQQQQQQQSRADDNDEWKPLPDKLGLGAPLPADDKDAAFGGKTSTSSQRLLEQLLGKKAARGHKASKQAGASTNSHQDVQNPASNAKSELKADSDEEDGRATTISSKPSRRRRPAPAVSVEADKESADTDDITVPSAPAEEVTKSSRKRGTSYLDQLLSEKASKKKKKKKQINHDGAAIAP